MDPAVRRDFCEARGLGVNDGAGARCREPHVRSGQVKDVTMKRIIRVAVAWLTAAVLAAPAMAQNESLLLYQGSDRQERLVEAARAEGELMLYTTLAEKNLRPLIEPFEKQYGVKVEVWRAGTSRVLQRAVSEAAAGRHEVDAYHFGSPQLEALYRENLLQPVESPLFAQLADEAVPAHKQWASTVFQVYVQAYNTDRIKKEALPKRYEDLLDPKWKGKLGIESESWLWYAALMKSMGEEKGRALFTEIVERNGMSQRYGYSLVNNMVVAGEVPLALTVYSHMPQASKDKGAPIDWFVLEPAIARANGIAIARHAKHPNAALLFYEYMLSADGAQGVFASMDYVPANTKLPSPLPDLRLRMADPVAALDEVDKWVGQFREVFGQGPTR